MPLCTRMHRLQTVAKNVTSGTLACLSCIGLLAIIILLGASPFDLGASCRERAPPLVRPE